MTPATRQSQAVLLAAAALGLLVSLGLTMLLGRALSAEGFGFAALVGAILVLARDLTDIGSSSVAAALVGAEPARERRVLGDLLALRIPLAVLAALACLGVALTRDRRDEQFVLVCAAAAILLFPLNAFATAFQLRQAIGRPALVSLACQVLCLAASLVLAAWHAAAFLFALLFVARDAMAVLGQAALAVRCLGYVPRPRLHGLATSPLLRRSAFYGVAAVCYSLSAQGMPLLIGLTSSPEELGTFAAAFRPIAPLLTLPWLVATPLAPALAALASTDPAGFADRAGMAVQSALGIGAVLAVAGLDLAQPALTVVYGGRFLTAPLDATAALRWLAVALGATCAFAGATVALLAMARERSILGLAVASLLLSLAGTAVLVPQSGFTGAAQAMALASVLVAGAAVTLAWRAGVRPPTIGAVARTCLPVVLLGAANSLLPSATWPHLALGTCATVAALAAVWKFTTHPSGRRTP